VAVETIAYRLPDVEHIWMQIYIPYGAMDRKFINGLDRMSAHDGVLRRLGTHRGLDGRSRSSFASLGH